MTYVLPHEEVSLVSFIDAMSKSLEVSQRDNFERLLRLLQPALLVCKDVRHDIGSTADT